MPCAANLLKMPHHYMAEMTSEYHSMNGLELSMALDWSGCDPFLVHGAYYLTVLEGGGRRGLMMW